MRTIREFFEQYKPTGADGVTEVFIDDGNDMLGIGYIDEFEILTKAFTFSTEHCPCLTFDSVVAKYGELTYSSFSVDATGFGIAIVFYTN